MEEKHVRNGRLSCTVGFDSGVPLHGTMTLGMCEEVAKVRVVLIVWKALAFGPLPYTRSAVGAEDGGKGRASMESAFSFSASRVRY